jgi:hypothetical protein
MSLIAKTSGVLMQFRFSVSSEALHLAVAQEVDGVMPGRARKEFRSFPQLYLSTFKCDGRTPWQGGGTTHGLVHS